jgi:hypothetical protein
MKPWRGFTPVIHEKTKSEEGEIEFFIDIHFGVNIIWRVILFSI